MIEAIDIKNKKKHRKIYIYLFFALLISYLLISPDDIMWAQDRFFYLVYAESSWTLIQNNISRGLFTFLSNEPLFLLINSALALLFSPESVVKIIIFTASFLGLYSLGRLSKYNFWILFLFLFVPTFLLKYTTHLRQGFAMSLYFWGLTGIANDKKLKYIRFLTPFIHSSMAFVLLYEFLEAFFKKIKFSSGLRLIFSSGVLTSFMVLIPSLAVMFGDRRSGQYAFEFGLSGSGLGFFIWLLAGSYFIIFNKKTYISTICSYGIIFYLVSYFYLDFGARVFESVFPLIALSVVIDKKKWYRLSYIAFLILYGLLGWYGRGGLNF